MGKMIFITTLLAVAQFCSVVAVNVTRVTDSYSYYCTGNCDVDVVRPTSPGVMLMGGGSDVDEAYYFQINKAGGGDFLVLRASGDGAYNPYIYELSQSTTPLNSVSTIVFNDASPAEDEFVISKIKAAEAIFFAGGDQSKYLHYWAGTSVQTEVQAKAEFVSIGGTSAGCAILGNHIYSADEGSVYSDEALEDPYNKYITLAPAFLKLPFLGNVITDTHFVPRDRMGRMLTFMARLLEDGATTEIHGVGVDEATALLLDVTSGSVTITGEGTAYVCSSQSKAAVCDPDTPLTFKDITCQRLTASEQHVYSFAEWAGEGDSYDLDVVRGRIFGQKYGPKF